MVPYQLAPLVHTDVKIDGLEGSAGRQVDYEALPVRGPANHDAVVGVLDPCQPGVLPQLKEGKNWINFKRTAKLKMLGLTGTNMALAKPIFRNLNSHLENAER